MVSTLFTDRSGGVSIAPYAANNLAFHVGDERESVTQNRERLQKLIGPTAFMNQFHGDRVVVVDGLPAEAPNADALITQEVGISLAVLVADCIPLLLWDESLQCVAAVHVGRVGLVNGIAGKVIGIMAAMGAQRIQGALGPSICGKCYQVGPDIYEEVCKVYPSAKSKTKSGHLALDLPGALSGSLSAAGIAVTRSWICTAESLDHFSYRRDGITGRQAGIIRL